MTACTPWFRPGRSGWSWASSAAWSSVLFRLDSRVVDVAVERAKAAVEFAEKTLTRQRKLLEVEGTSLKLVQETEQQLSAARAEWASTQAQRTLLTITAPLSGSVVRVNAKPGEAVDLTAVLVELIDLERLVVTAHIPSSELANLKTGQSVELHAGPLALPVGTLASVGSQVDPKTDTAPVRVSIPVNTGLRPGQFVSLRIVSEERRDRLTVPIESVVRVDESDVIAVVEGEKATRRTVTRGLRDGVMVEIEGEGLKEGMVIVTEGSYGLPKETKVRVLRGASAANPLTAAAPALELKQTVSLPGVKGGFDLMAADLDGKRLFVCAQDNHTLEVIDLATGKRVRSVEGLNEPKWVVFRPESNRLYVSTAGDGKVTVLDATTFAVLKEFTFREKANNLRFDAATKQLFVGVGKTFGALAIIDTTTDAVAGDITLANFPKQFELEGNLIYVNVPAANHVAVVDRAKKTVVAVWPVRDAKDNVPMALDRANHRLFIACDPGKFVAFNTETGTAIASLNISAEADGIGYDAGRKRLYISCGEGWIDVIQQNDADHYQLQERLPTVKGAGTSLFVPQLERLFLGVPQVDGQSASIRIYQPRP